MDTAMWCFRSVVVILMLSLGQNDGQAQQSAIHTQQRAFALVIGNSSYRYVPSLANPANDARALDGALRELGFDTILALDQTAAGLNQALESFTRRIQNAEIVLVYFAGHGVQDAGRNFLLPIDVGAQDRGTGMLSVDDMMRRIDRASPATAAKIVVLDACRNNPLAGGSQTHGPRTRGLARVDWETPPPTGGAHHGYMRIVAFAAAANEVAYDGVGVHSPYTRSLIRHIRQPGLELAELFRAVAADVMSETRGQQRPEFLVQSTRAVFLQSPRATDCDRFAIEGQNFLGVMGVPFDDIVPNLAIPACEAAVRATPHSARLNANLGRSYEKAGRLSDALRHYRVAADVGYPPALNLLGIMYLSGCGLQAPEVERGITLIARARELGNLNARATLTTHDMLAVTERAGVIQLQRALTQSGYFQGTADGRVTQALRDALARFQETQGLARRGFTLETAHALRAYAAVPHRWRCH